MCKSFKNWSLPFQIYLSRCILLTRMGFFKSLRGTPWNVKSGNFQMQKRMFPKAGASKVVQKNGVTYAIILFPSWLMVLKLSKMVHFVQFSWWRHQNPGNGMTCRVQNYGLEDTAYRNFKKTADSAKIKKSLKL